LKWVYVGRDQVAEKWPKCLFFSSKHTSLQEKKNIFFLAMHQANIFHDSHSLMLPAQVAYVVLPSTMKVSSEELAESSRIACY